MASRMLFDFLCECGKVFEELIPSDEHTCMCECGKQATRQISAVRFDWRNMGVDPDFATCADKWAKMQEQKARVKEEGYNLSHY